MMLLAVDLGLRMGLAAYGRDGRLRWHRSHHSPSRTHLRKLSRQVLAEHPDTTHLVLEGDRSLCTIWERPASHIGAVTSVVSPEQWREGLLYPRDRRSGSAAKERARDLAQEVIRWSESNASTSPRTDAAEAILIGLWGVLELGWLEQRPPFLKP